MLTTKNSTTPDNNNSISSISNVGGDSFKVLITVYVANRDDINTVRVCCLLEHYSLPFRVVDVDDETNEAPANRHRRSEFTSVPQVFLAKRQIGGLQECQALLKQWKAKYKRVCDAYFAELQAIGHAPLRGSLLMCEPRFSYRTDKHKTALPASCPLTECPAAIALPDGAIASLVDTMVHLQLLIPRAAIHHQHRTYAKAFTGAVLRTTLETKHHLTPEDTVRFIKRLERSRIIRDVDRLRREASASTPASSAASTASGGSSSGNNNKRQKPPKRDWRVYQLQCDATPHILNSYMFWTNKLSNKNNVHKDGSGGGGAVGTSSAGSVASRASSHLTPKTTISSSVTSKAPLELLHELHRGLAQIERDSLNEEGLLDYQLARQHVWFRRLQEALCELQVLQLPEDWFAGYKNNDATAFGLNLWHFLLRYAYLTIGVPVNDKDELVFLSTLAWEFTASTTTCPDWGTTTSIRQVQTLAALREQVVEEHEYDPRVFMALYVGPHQGSFQSPANPSDLWFTPENLDEQLDHVARVFCHDDHCVHVTHTGRQLSLSYPWRWYRQTLRNSDHDDTHSGNTLAHKDDREWMTTYILPYLQHESTKYKQVVHVVEEEDHFRDVMQQQHPQHKRPATSHKMPPLVYHEVPLGFHTSAGPWYQESETRLTNTLEGVPASAIRHRPPRRGVGQWFSQKWRKGGNHNRRGMTTMMINDNFSDFDSSHHSDHTELPILAVPAPTAARAS